MTDGVPKQTGNSRYLKSAIDSDITFDQFRDMLRNGTLPIDLNGINPDGWAELGTPLNKASLLSDEPLKRIGLATSSVPTDMFNVLSKVGDLHVWRRTVTNSQKVPAKYELGAERKETVISWSSYTTDNFNIYYSDSVSVSDSGTVSLVSEQHAWADPSDTNLDFIGFNIVNKFVRFTSENPVISVSSGIFFVKQDAEWKEEGDSVTVSKIQKVTGIPAIPAGTTIDYPVSTNRNAYTGGTSGSTTIEYFGNLGDKSRAKIISYVGTGTYGSDNPNSLHFGFVPDLVIICGSESISGTPNTSITVVRPATYVASNSNGGNGLYAFIFTNITWGNTFKWYTDQSYPKYQNPQYQANLLGFTYYAIGIKV